MTLYGRRLQELLLPEQAAAVYVVSGLCASHKWHLELACKGSTHYIKYVPAIAQSYCITYVGACEACSNKLIGQNTSDLECQGFGL